MSEKVRLAVSEVAERLGLLLAAGEEGLEAEVTGALASDLLSYVMANGKSGQLWLTIQTHPNIVAVAALAHLAGIVIVSGFEPEEDTLARAEEEGMPILLTAETAYTVAGRLYELGVR
ncbi:MAG: DRTGG domain-containing protein [Armatimonadota bacterium]